MDDTTVAGKFFKAQMEFGLVESELENQLCLVLGEEWDDAFDHFTYDWYDGSFEIIDAQEGMEFTPEQLELFWQMGFERCWINYAGKKRHEEGSEKYYWKPMKSLEGLRSS